MVTAKDAQEAVKSIMGQLIEEILEAERKNEVGYSRYDYRNKKTSNIKLSVLFIVSTALGSFTVRVPHKVLFS